jgi:hypothetical protein
MHKKLISPLSGTSHSNICSVRFLSTRKAAISQDAPLEFHVTAQSEEYIEPSQTQLLIKCKIL